MIGNIGVHFEDYGEAVTDMAKTLKNLSHMGYKKVAATSIANFTQYEDLQDIIKKKGLDIEVIPAVQVYFENPNDRLTLIAKDYEGYLSLCKIITESNELGTVIEDPSNKSANKPIVYMENLKKNVNKGHVLLSTGGKNNYFLNHLYYNHYNYTNLMKDLKYNIREKMVFQHKDFFGGTPVTVDTIIGLVAKYNELKQFKKPTKTELNYAKKDFNITGSDAGIKAYEKRLEEYNGYKELLDHMKPFIKDLEKIKKDNLKDYYQLLEYEENDLISQTESDPKEVYNGLIDIFGKDNVVFELEDHNDEIEREAMKALIRFAKTTTDPIFVAGNDVRLGVPSNSDDLFSEKLRLNVARFLKNKKYEDLEKNIDEYCIKTEEELREGLLNIVSEEVANKAIENTENYMKDMFIEVTDKENHYPKYCDDENAEFEKRCLDGIKWRFPDGWSEEYEERLKKELDVIQTMGYAGYHLIVQDYLNYARLLGYLTEEEVENAPLTIEELDKYIDDNNIVRIGSGIGPGRGSAAGSICCYLLGITDVDPIKNKLIFERFLNPERVSMPDIDSDFRPDVRLRVREYIKHKYGEKNVCEIVTKSYEQPKGQIRAAARYIGSQEAVRNNTPDSEKKWQLIGEKLSKMFTAQDTGGDMTLEDFITANAETFDSDQKKVVSYAKTLTNMFSGYSQHAAGVIISKDEIGAKIPLMWNSTSNSLQTQCQMAQAEERGYLKMDVLGLRNLHVITDSVKTGIPTDVCQDPIKREKEILENTDVIKEIFGNGLTTGVFQFESDGMKNMLMKFKPETFEDIVLLNATFRPGPLQYIDEIIERKNWERSDKSTPEPKGSITIKNNDLQKILSPTYGCPVYQEQIMEIFREMAGYSLGRADEVRRAMSKKKVDKLAYEKENFVYGNEKEIEKAGKDLEVLKEKLETAPDNEKESIRKEIANFKTPAVIDGCIKKQGLTKEEAEMLFEQMMPFAKYGFNKSHATAYSTVALETAWLKKNRTKEFFASALNHWKDRDEIPKYTEEMAKFGIKMLPPVLNSKEDVFTVEEGGIRFPITKAKNISDSVIDKISNNPDKNDTSIQGFIMTNKDATITQLKQLIKLGCFTECYKFKNETHKNLERTRVNGNKHYMLKWAEENFKTISKIRDLKSQSQRKEELTEITNDYMAPIKEKGFFTSIPKTSEEVFEERGWELDLTGMIFSYEDDLNVIKEFSNTNTFKDLCVEDSTNPVPVPCVVLSCSDKKFTKNNNPYYEVSLMDREGTVFKRRFKSVITKTNGIFKLYPESKKYFLSDPRPISDTFVFAKKKIDEKDLVDKLLHDEAVFKPPVEEIERGEGF